jgi:TonB-dependent receptor-like protein
LAGTAEAAPRTVRGVVTRQGSPTPIAGATVLGERGEVAASDIDGYFAIVLDTAERELTVVATGYLMRIVAVRSETLHVELAEATGAEVIEVTGRAPEETKPLSYDLSVGDIRSLPGTGNDILRAAQILPGVARIPFSFGGLVLRGTSPRDTAIYLDGIEVPIGFHFGGITSFYPSGMLADLSLVAGGFDASYGRAQGGIVGLTTREPRTDRWRMGGSIGLFDSAVQAEGPFAGGGILIGVRRSYFDQVAAPFVADDLPLPGYWDFQLRTTFGDPRKDGRVTPMIFGSVDRVTSNDLSLTSMFVRVAAPYLVQRDAVTFRLVPWFGTNRLTFENSEKPPAATFERPEWPGGVRAELIRDAPWGHLRGGLDIGVGYLSTAQANVIDPQGPGHSINGKTTLTWTDVAEWQELRWMLDGENFTVKPGLRVESYGLTGEVVIDPRLNISQRLVDTATLRLAMGRFHQPPTPGDVDTTDGNPNLESSYVDQFALGFDAELPESISASVTGFFDYGNRIGVPVRNPRPGSDLPDPDLGGLGPTFQLLLEKQLGFSTYRLNVGRARSYGVELSLKRNVGRWFTLMSYTLSRSERIDDPRMNPNWRPFELDQHHNLQLAASVALEKWRLGARFQLVTGNPYSPVNTDGFQTPWAARLPLFASLDLRADRHWPQCWGDVVLYIDVQNVTNRYNVEGRDSGIDDRGNFGDQDIPGLPIVPFIGVEFVPLR